MAVRAPTHAGSWYSGDKKHLSQQLDGWLDQVPAETTPIGAVSSQQGPVSVPTPHARAIIAPHAGYSYSGPAAAWAYKSVDWSNAKRVFLLGPSHHYYLRGAATTACDTYRTPLGDLAIDTDIVDDIAQKGGLERMSKRVDEEEHSLELHLPYIYKMLSTNPHPARLVPIMVGDTDEKLERKLGRLIAPYLHDPSNVFVISSDFCHWGSRFRYTYYQPASGEAKQLKAGTPPNKSYPIHASIAAVDQESMDAVESGSHRAFLEQLEETGNTVCGRHPIGVFMAAVEASTASEQETESGPAALAKGTGRFKFVRYERSSLVESVADSSVSYCSAFAVLQPAL